MKQKLSKIEMFFLRHDRNFIVDLESESNTSDDDLHNVDELNEDVQKTNEKIFNEM